MVIYLLVYQLCVCVEIIISIAYVRCTNNVTNMCSEYSPRCCICLWFMQDGDSTASTVCHSVRSRCRPVRMHRTTRPARRRACRRRAPARARRTRLARWARAAAARTATRRAVRAARTKRAACSGFCPKRSAAVSRRTNECVRNYIHAFSI